MADWFGDSGFTIPDVPEMPTGMESWSAPNFDWGQFSMPSMPTWPSNFQFDPQTGWPDMTAFGGGAGGAQGGGGGGWNFGGALDTLGKVGALGKFGFDAYNAWNRGQQMSDYNKAVEDYYKNRQAQEADYMKAFNDYLGRRAEWEGGLAEAMGGASEGMAEGMGEFQKQMAGWQEKIGGAIGDAKMVMGEFMSAATPLLGQSQELLVSGVAALARGEEPPQWRGILNEMKQKGMAVGMQSLVSAGMSPEAARAAVVPKVTQDAQTMLLQLATQQVQQGLAIGAQGMTGLEGAGKMAAVQGQMAGQGATVSAQSISPLMQQYLGMLQAMGGLFGGSFPGMPGGAAGPPPAPSA